MPHTVYESGAGYSMFGAHKNLFHLLPASSVQSVVVKPERGRPERRPERGRQQNTMRAGDARRERCKGKDANGQKRGKSMKPHNRTRIGYIKFACDVIFKKKLLRVRVIVSACLHACKCILGR